MEWGGQAAPVWTGMNDELNDRLGYCPQHLTATEDSDPTRSGVRKFPPGLPRWPFPDRFPRQIPP